LCVHAKIVATARLCGVRDDPRALPWMCMILVTGATGNVGGALVEALRAAGQDVRGVSRSGGVDLNDPATVPFDGATAAFFMSGYAPGLFAAAKEQGVERAVLLSGSSADGGDRANAVSRYMMDSEDALKASGLEYTILRPHAFFSNALRWLPQLRAGDVIREAFPAVPSSAIDPADIAAVAAQALTSGDHAGHTYRLTGPEALRIADRVRILGEALNRPLTLDPFTDEEARADMSKSMPPEYVDAFMAFYAGGTLDESMVLPTVEQVTGRPPRAFAAWAAEHAHEFR
jgi:uncharacterized protein YbjT (DUF2867 family)